MKSSIFHPGPPIHFLNPSAGKAPPALDPANEYRRLLSDKMLDALVKTPDQNGMDAIVHFIGIGESGCAANAHIQNHYHQVCMPAAKGDIYLSSLQSGEMPRVSTGWFSNRSFPAVLILTVDPGDQAGMQLAVAAGRYGVRNRIPTILVQTANNANPNSLQQAAHAVCTATGAADLASSLETGVREQQTLTALTALLLFPAFVCIEFYEIWKTLTGKAEIDEMPLPPPRRLVCGFGVGEGGNRAENATRLALQDTGLQLSTLQPAGILAIIRTDHSYSLNEYDYISHILAESLPADTVITTGDYFDLLSDGLFEASVILSIPVE